MGYDYQRKISLLKEQTADEKEGRIRLWRAIPGSIAALFLITYIIGYVFAVDVPPQPEPVEEGKPQEANAPTAADHWQVILQHQFSDRVQWLESSPFALTPGGAAFYESYGQWLVGTLNITKKRTSEIGDIVDMNGALGWIKHSVVSLGLRIGFIVIAMAPLWLISGVGGYFAFRHRFKSAKTDDILGICDRGKTPFYSGIYGPLRPNSSFSGTDLAVPNLAVPQMVKGPDAVKHPLVAMLRKYGALNQTTLDLVRVILAYRDYPALVEDENISEEDMDAPLDEPEKPQVSQTGFVTNVGGTIEQSAMNGLAAVLAAHQTLQRYTKTMEKQGITSNQLNGQFGTHVAQLEQFTKSLPELGKLLVRTLTPHRAWAIGHLPITLLATAYLSTEAGKCLVYKREAKGFTRISRFPNLQARAILQSLVSFIKDHNGDTRMILRQAIICARRHGDFGRAFLPERMPVESRALRDWLEVMYADPKKREIQAQLVELDAHIEELSVNFKNGYAKKVRQSMSANSKPQVGADPSASHFWKGIAHKSVVMTPLLEVIALTLRGIDEGRIKRVSQLLQITRRVQMNLSISARLPGFKRQAAEAQTGAIDFRDAIFGGDSKEDLRDRWAIVRRVLTKYNWLSTRVGDDAVPADGIVHSIVVDDYTGTLRPMSIEMLVPLRQRRFEEMLGKQWETNYYFDSPHPSNIQIFIEHEKFIEAERRERIRRPGSNEESGTGGKTPTAASA